MAQRPTTYKWGQVLSIIKRKSSPGAQDDMGVFIANRALNYIWDKYDWRESLGSFPSFYLVPNKQDYGTPAVTIPSDFYGLRTAQLVRATNVPPYRADLAIIKDLQPTHVRALPQSIGYNANTQSIRVYPRVPENIGSPEWMIQGTYKKRPVEITAAALSTTLLPFDDVYFDVFLETAKYVSYSADEDPRAGQITYGTGGQMNATGQAAKMMAIIDWAASREGLEMGDPVIAPSESLVSSASDRVGALGYGIPF